MTTNQIAYFRAQEDKRHNLVSEALSKYNTDKNFESNIYGSNKSYAASIYSSDKHLEGTKYAADQSRAASQYSADRHLEGTIYSADQSRIASMYSADQARAASKYSAEMSYAANVKRAELGLEGTQYSADKKFRSDIISEANRARIAREDRSSRERIAEQDRKLKDKQFAAEFDLKQFIANSEAQARLYQNFRDATSGVRNITGAGKDVMGIIKDATSTGLSIASLFA